MRQTVRVLVLIVSLRSIALYPIGAEKLSYTSHKLFLCIIRPYIDQNSMLTESFLKNLGNIETVIGSYCIDISE